VEGEVQAIANVASAALSSTATILAAILAALISGIVTWVMNLSVKRRLARLRSELASAEERLRSTLRVQGELRLKLFTLGAEAVSQCRRASNLWWAGLNELSAAVVEGRDTTEAECALREARLPLMDAGVMLPPDLEDAWDKYWGRLSVTAANIRDAAGSDDERERRRTCARARSELGDLAIGFTDAARQWKATEWKRAQAGFPDVDVTEPQEAK
jgi:hypothetical protein